MNRKHWVDIECEINGKRYPFTISPALSLMELLRDEGLTSVKQGCGVGECGACTVLIDGVATDSCLYLAVWADGKRIRTAEGEVKMAGSLRYSRPTWMPERYSVVSARRVW